MLHMAKDCHGVPLITTLKKCNKITYSFVSAIRQACMQTFTPSFNPEGRNAGLQESWNARQRESYPAVLLSDRITGRPSAMLA